MGFDSVRKGPNGINCHYSLFNTIERAKDWNNGATDAKVPDHIPSEQIIKYIKEKERREK